MSSLSLWVVLKFIHLPRFREQHNCHLGSYWQCDQIGWFFCQLGYYFGSSLWFFWKDEDAQRNGHIWATFWLSKYFTFQLNKQFQNMVFCNYIKVAKVVWCNCFVLSNWVLVLIFWHFLASQLFWLLFKKNWWFYQIIWPPCLLINKWPLMTFHPGPRNKYLWNWKYVHLLSVSFINKIF